MGQDGPKYCVRGMKRLGGDEQERGIDSARSERAVGGSGEPARSIKPRNGGRVWDRIW
jgi:hypothetical protein